MLYLTAEQFIIYMIIIITLLVAVSAIVFIIIKDNNHKPLRDRKFKIKHIVERGVDIYEVWDVTHIIKKRYAVYKSIKEAHDCITRVYKDIEKSRNDREEWMSDEEVFKEIL